MKHIARAAALPFVLLLVACNGCNRHEEWPGPKDQPIAQRSGPVVTGSLDTTAHPASGAHPRIFLTQERLAVLVGLKDAAAPVWQKFAESCDAAAKDTMDSGYEAWDWANATLSLAICHKVTHKPEYARAALRYFTAMLDDKYKVLDGAGGDLIVHHDDGYSMRTHGWLGALAYDWLYDMPGMDDGLRKHAMDRFLGWVAWFKTKGYSHDEPISNYYMSYFGAVAYAGLAADGHDPRAAELRQLTQDMWNKGIVPTYRKRLEGGDFPEGWNYGDLVGTVLAIYVDAETRAHPGGTRSLYEQLPWLKESIALHTHVLWPDGKRCWDSGDWPDEGRPASQLPHMLEALSITLPANDPAGKAATFLSRLAKRPLAREEWKWLGILSEDAGHPAEDPRKGERSYLSRGTATVIARTDWSPSAVWVAMSSAPTISDHQHLDAGHFEIVRGNDPLAIDAGAYAAYSTLSHNTIAIGADKVHLTYPPNQGRWSDTAGIARFEDLGGFVYARADFGSAYNPAGYPTETKNRTASRVEREMIFSRTPLSAGGAGTSARVILYDRLTLTKPEWPTTWMFHAGPAPDLRGPTARINIGQSEMLLTTLLPQATSKLVDETNNKEADRPWFSNMPPKLRDSNGNDHIMTSFRLEIASPAGNVERRFLHAMAIGAREMDADKDADKEKQKRLAPARIDGIAGAEGVQLDGEVYVFPEAADHEAPADLAYRVRPGATRHIVVGLAPAGRYRVIAGADGGGCKVVMGAGPADDATARAASPQGTLSFALGAGCGLTAP